jgi:hypothetical protein
MPIRIMSFAVFAGIAAEILGYLIGLPADLALLFYPLGAAGGMILTLGLMTARRKPLVQPLTVKR